MRSKCRLGREGERGQAFMELAVSLVFLLILLAAVIDLGWAFYTMIAMRDAAQEAASYGALCPVLIDASNVKYSNEQGVRDRLRNSATAPLDMRDIPELDINGNQVIEVTWLDSTGQNVLPSGELPERGDMVRVSFTVQHHIVTPFVGAFIGTWDYPLNVKVSDTVMSNVCPELTAHPTPTP